ncbi:hypothetical protein A3H38_05590 [candidate division WOR-1 bacterium RIFCSPLOWO2_02_FULL_46_20]|nr:MAG: hypothetical protein A3H38_05590 [candidate division WOR-1 bacterium RIFCSPLOWO2_02_FULL_46_20]
MLLSSGVPLLEALHIIKNISKRVEIDFIIQQLAQGESLASAMKKTFPAMMVSSIEGGERIGSLEAILDRLAKHYEARAETEDKIKSALIYPSFVTSLCLVSLFVLFVFVLPGFKTLFVDLNTELPLFTRIIIGLGDVFSKIWYLPFMVTLTMVFLYLRYEKRDEWLLKIKYYSRGQVIGAFRTLGSLLQGGIPIVEAFKTTASTSNNKAFREIIFKIKESIENGVRLAEALAQYEIFPNEAVQMVAVGENSGNLAEMLLSISGFYEKEKEIATKRFTMMLEPVLTLVVGLVVGVIAIAMFLPMMNVISQIQ